MSQQEQHTQTFTDPEYVGSAVIKKSPTRLTVFVPQFSEKQPIQTIAQQAQNHTWNLDIKHGQRPEPSLLSSQPFFRSKLSIKVISLFVLALFPLIHLYSVNKGFLSVFTSLACLHGVAIVFFSMCGIILLCHNSFVDEGSSAMTLSTATEKARFTCLPFFRFCRGTTNCIPLRSIHHFRVSKDYFCTVTTHTTFGVTTTSISNERRLYRIEAIGLLSYPLCGTFISPHLAEDVLAELNAILNTWRQSVPNSTLPMPFHDHDSFNMSTIPIDSSTPLVDDPDPSWPTDISFTVNPTRKLSICIPLSYDSILRTVAGVLLIVVWGLCFMLFEGEGQFNIGISLGPSLHIYSQISPMKSQSLLVPFVYTYLSWFPFVLYMIWAKQSVSGLGGRSTTVLVDENFGSWRRARIDWMLNSTKYINVDVLRKVCIIRKPVSRVGGRNYKAGRELISGNRYELRFVSHDGSTRHSFRRLSGWDASYLAGTIRKSFPRLFSG